MASSATSKTDSPAIKQGWTNLQQSRTYVKHKFPYFFAPILGFIPYHVPHIHTMFVTKKMVLGVDMEWFGTIDEEVGGGCLIHESMHILRDITRIEAMEDPKIAGVAFDMPINDDLRKCGIKLPPWVIYSSTYGLPEGLSGEKYYELLKKMKAKLPDNPMIGSGSCGSCDGHGDDVAPLPDVGRSASDVRYFRSQGIQDLKEHARKGGFGAGKMPSSLEDILSFDGSEQAIIPWQQIASVSLGRAVGRIKYGHADYSLRRPSKRSYALGFPRPGLVMFEPTVCYIEDTSGSMGHPQLKENRVEMCSAMRQLGITEVWFIQSDVTVKSPPRRITVTDLMNLPVVGRGGTDFCASIEEAMHIIPTPDLIIYSTDGDGPAPKVQPRGVEFIWLLAPGPWTKSPCDWGTQILTTNDPDERKQYEILM